jgi:RHS repeat-associated protein
MTVAAKHFDPQLGIDIHTYLIGPLPTPHIGIVLDPFDYIPLIGGTVQVHGVKRATAGCGGLDVHIPVGGLWVPPMRLPGGPQFDDEIFMGSRTVSADGEPFSRITMPVLACNLVGMVPPIRLKKPGRIPLSLVLPTTINLAIPNTVNVGGPPTVNLTALAMRGGLSALGAIARKSGVSARASAAFTKLRQRVFGNMKPGFLKCKVLRAEPVDIRDGSVSVNHEDFVVPGRLPLAWQRHYSSADLREGACGHGWMTPADIRLERFGDGSALFVDFDGAAVFPATPDGEGEGAAVRELVNGARLAREHDDRGAVWVVRTKAGLRHVFRDAAPGAAVLATRVACIERIEDLCGNSWTFERQHGHLVRIVESGPPVDGTGARQQGRFLEVDSRNGRIERIQLHDPATGLNHPLVRYRYDAAGDLVAAHDALDAARTFAYREHRMVGHTDRVGLSFHYAFDARWRVVQAWGDGGLYRYRFDYDDVIGDVEITDSLGHVSIVKFDANRLPLCEIDPLDGVTVFEYDELGRTTAVVDPMGLRTGFEYDDRGNLLKLTSPDGTAVQTAYDDDDQPVAVAGPDGATWTRQWDARGLLVAQATPLGATSRYEYDATGQLLAHTDPLGATTRLHFDRHGQLQGIVDPLGATSTFRHDALGRLLERSDASGQRSRYAYDAKGRLLNVVQPGGRTARAEYDAEDQLLKYTDESGHVTRLEYCGIGRIARRIQPDGHAVRYEYDTEEQLVAVINQRGERYGLRRDPLGRIIEEVDYWGQARHYRYDAAGRLTATTDPLGQVIEYTTDKLGRITRKLLPDPDRPGQVFRETFKYDKAGQLVELHNPNRHVQRRFDPEGRLLEETQDAFRITNTFDAVGQRVLRETSAGNRVACTFDLRGQVSSVAINDEPPIVIERDALGRAVTERLSPQVRRQLQYDDRGLLTAQTVLRDEAPLFDTRYAYDSAANLVSRSDSQQGTDSYSYDPMGRILSHTDPAGRLTHFLNDPAGDRLRTRVHETRMKQAVGGGNLPDDWTREGSFEGLRYVFDRAGNLIRRGEDRPAPLPGDAAGDLQLRWDANQRLVESAKDGQVTRYGYDPLGRRVFKRNPTHTTWFFWDGDALLGEVTHANDALGTPAPAADGNVVDFLAAKRRRKAFEALHPQAREYVYYPGTFVPLALVDKKISTEARAALGTSPTITPAPSRADVSHPGTPGPREVATGFAGLGAFVLGGAAARDAAGGGSQLAIKQLPAGEFEAGPDLGNTGAATSTPLGRLGGAPVESSGAKLPESVPPVHTGEALPEITVTDAAASDDAIPPSQTAVTCHFHVDPNGCPTRITDTAGQVLWSATYSAWGTVTRQNADVIDNPIRFQGQYFDAETGMHYNRFRYYDSALGQFVAVDPTGFAGGVNFYAYAPNALAWGDPMGLMPWGMNGATVRIWVIDDNGVAASKEFKSIPRIHHAEINGLNWFIRDGGGLNGKHVVIGDVVGHFKSDGVLPVPICKNCRTDIFSEVQRGGAASVTFPKTVGNRVLGYVTIDAGDFAEAGRRMREIRDMDISDNEKARRAWPILEKLSSCRK